MYEGMNAGQIGQQMQRTGFTQEGLNAIYQLRGLGPAPILPPALVGARRGQGRDQIRIYDAQGRVMTGATRSLANNFFNNYYQTAVDPFDNYDGGNWAGVAGMILGGGAALSGAGAAPAAGAGGATGAGAGATAAGAGGAAGAAAGALPEIVVTGTVGSGLGAGAAGAAAGAAGGLSGVQNGNVNTNVNNGGSYGDYGGLNNNSGTGIFGNGGQGGMTGVGQGNAGQLFGNTGINTGGVGGVGGTGSGVGGSGAGGMSNSSWTDWVDLALDLGGAWMAHDAAGDASDAQQAGAREAVAESRRQYDQSREDLAPYRAAGTIGLSEIGRGFGYAPPGSTGATELGDFNRDFTMADFEKDPGYQFRMDEGSRALEGSASASGGLFSGATGKRLERYGQDYASNEFGAARDRFNSDRTQRFNRLAALSGIGQTATNTGIAAGQNSSQDISNGIIEGANAAAAGRIGQANAAADGFESLGNWYRRRQYGGG